ERGMVSPGRPTVKRGEYPNGSGRPAEAGRPSSRSVREALQGDSSGVPGRFDPSGQFVGEFLSPVVPAAGIYGVAHADVDIVGFKHVGIVARAVLPGDHGVGHGHLTGGQVFADILVAKAS